MTPYISLDDLFKRNIGQWLIPLRGKIPIMDAWQSLPPVTPDTVRDWLDIGYNLGLRTGIQSGLIVIDDDQEKNGVPAPDRYVPPSTGLVAETPTGGRHYYYVIPDPYPKNSSSEIAPHVDVRSEGGQCVFPGSAHPIVKTHPYRWVSIDEPSVFPAELVEKLRGPTVRVDMKRPAPTASGNGYAGAALLKEAHRVRTAAEGSRNDILNKASFNLGQLVAGGALEHETVQSELTAAAAIAGLTLSETTTTIRSGMTAGAANPRRAPKRTGSHGDPRELTESHGIPWEPTKSHPPRDVLVPGSHNIPPDGTYREQGIDAFASQVLNHLEPGAIYRRGQAIGEITGSRFQVVTPDRFRSISDASVRLVAGRLDKEGTPQLQFRPCSKDLAGVVTSYGGVRGKVRDLEYIATYPVCVGSDFEPAGLGWNPDSGVFLAADHLPEPLDLETSKAVIEDLIFDFPFGSPADRANYIGLLLTPLLRPAIREPVPMHLIGSPVERTGKTKLAEIVLGCGVLGYPTPAMQLGVREEEREKRITAVLMGGSSVIHLDNLREFVDSPALASLLTSTAYQGRELNHSRMLTIPNGLTIVASGNNIQATGEIAKRVVPIMLLPAQEAPELRQDYRHPNLRAYVEQMRPRVLAALLGLVRAWRDAGRPLGVEAFGGFERWAAVIGGIMANAGWSEWLTNLQDWRGGADAFGANLRTFVGIWSERHGEEWVKTSDLFDLADELGLFSQLLSKGREDRARRTLFGQRVITRIANRVVREMRLEVTGQGKRRRARLVGPFTPLLGATLGEDK